jgi:hypothetical protein
MTPERNGGEGMGDSRKPELKIMLVRSRPSIWRRVQVPDSMRLPDLHAVMQCVFGLDTRGMIGRP